MYHLNDQDLLLQHNPRGGYVGRIKDLPDNKKPRERLIQEGPETLSIAELMAIIFGSGTKKEDVLSMTSRISHEYGDKGLAFEREPHKLKQELDIPLTKACQIIAAFQIGKRAFQNTGSDIYLRNADEVFAYLSEIRNLPKEQLRGLYLNSRYQLIHDEVISIGTLTSNVVHPREVFRPALQYAAAAIIIAHKHPSGDPTPTEADIFITEQLIDAGHILGIEILDHVVIGKDNFESIDASYHV